MWEDNNVFEEESLEDSDNITSVTYTNMVKKIQPIENENENEIQEYILSKLIIYSQNNEQIRKLLTRDYKNNSSRKYNEFYIINAKWISNYLKFYNYNKVFEIIKNMNEEINVHNLFIQIKNSSIFVISEDKELNGKEIKSYLGEKKYFYS